MKKDASPEWQANCITRWRSGDVNALNDLYKERFGLIRFCVLKAKRAWPSLEFDELLSIANLAFMHTVESYKGPYPFGYKLMLNIRRDLHHAAKKRGIYRKYVGLFVNMLTAKNDLLGLGKGEQP